MQRCLCFLLSKQLNLELATILLKYTAQPWCQVTALLRQGCNLAHVLGLFRISGAHTTAFALGARGALADLALWAIARLQTRLFASRTFARCA